MAAFSTGGPGELFLYDRIQDHLSIDRIEEPGRGRGEADRLKLPSPR
jgi:hypothetical protein